MFSTSIQVLYWHTEQSTFAFCDVKDQFFLAVWQCLAYPYRVRRENGADMCTAYGYM